MDPSQGPELAEPMPLSDMLGVAGKRAERAERGIAVAAAGAAGAAARHADAGAGGGAAADAAAGTATASARLGHVPWLPVIAVWQRVSTQVAGFRSGLALEELQRRTVERAAMDTCGAYGS